MLIERNQQAPMSDEYPLMAFIANEGVAPKGERYDRSALVTDTVNKLYKKTEKGDFIYSSNNLETGSIGLNKYGKACISPVYSIFEPTGIADSDFLGRRLVRKDFINAMVKWRQGVIYGQWRIHESDFLKIEITVPSDEEQRKIGTYLDQLDHLITLHQRKFDEAFIERRDKTEKENEDILLSCAINGMFLNSELFGHFRGTTTIGYLRVKKNDLILSAQNLHLGNANVNLRFEHGIISPAYKVYDLNNCNPEFVQSWVKRDDTKNFFLAATTEGASQCRKNIEWETLGKQTISMPSLDEQNRVGSFFKQLDNLITLHQRKGKAAVSGCFLNCSSLEKSSAQSRTLELFGQTSNQEIKYIIDGLSILGGKLRNFCVKLIILLSYTRINDIAKYHISRNTECVHNIN